MKITSALKGVSGEFELNRVVGAIGGLAYIVGVQVFVGWDVIVKERPFDVVAYCLAFPGGLAAVVGSIAGAVAWKDRGVATAKIIAETGAQPGTAPVTPPKAAE